MTWLQKLKPIALGLVGIALGFLIYQFALDYYFLHQARVQNDVLQAVIQLQKMQADQAKDGAGK